MLISIFSKATEANNPHIYTNVMPEGLYILTDTDVIIYFRLAINLVHGTATDFTVIKLSFSKKSGKLLESASSRFSAM